MKYFLKTFGCQQNISDSERIKTVLENAGFEETEKIENADIILANTCSVRKHAEDKAYGLIKNAHDLQQRKNNNSQILIGITGCMVRKTSDRVSEIKDKILVKNKYLDFVFRIEDVLKLPTIIQNLLNSDDCCLPNLENNNENYFTIKPKLTKPFFSFVPIMSGCNHFCSYCIVPYARGREKSRDFNEIISECKKLADSGVKEIQLLGQNVNAYKIENLKSSKNRSFDSDFAFLLNEIAKIKDIRRIRFTSPHPSGMTQDVIDVMAKNQNICKQMHLPVQSGSNEILKKMNRPYAREDFQKITKYARKKMPNISISTDLIIGFPTETDLDFLNTKKLCLEEKFDMIYFAKYSPRPGTLAAKMKDNVSIQEKKRRFNEIQEVLTKTALEKNQEMLEKNVEVLIDDVDNGLASGKTEGLKTVHFKTKAKTGDFVNIKITEATSWFLKGEE